MKKKNSKKSVVSEPLSQPVIERKPKKGSYAPYTYDHIMGCIDKIRDIICDVTTGMLSKNTTRTLLYDSLHTLDLVKAAFHDSQDNLNKIEFKVYSR